METNIIFILERNLIIFAMKLIQIKKISLYSINWTLVAYQVAQQWEIHATMKGIWACKDLMVHVAQQLVKEACDSTGCGVAVKATLAGQEFRFCCSRSHRVTQCHFKQQISPLNIIWRMRNFHQSITCFISWSSIGAYTHTHISLI